MKQGWQTTALGEVCERVTVGHVGITSPYYRDRGILFLRTQNVGVSGLDLSEVKHITPEFHSSLKKSELKAGDILMSRIITHTVHCALIPTDLGPANCANVVLVRPGKQVVPEFLAHYIRSPDAQRHLLDRKVGSAQLVVNTTVVQNWPVPLPPLPEQRRIVGILDETFDGIANAKANAEKNLQNARAIFESHLQSVFTQRGKGWVEKRLSDLSRINYGYTESASASKVGPHFLRITDIQDNRVDWSTVPYCPIEASDYPKFKLANGDIVFARTGATTGKSYLVIDPPEAVFASYLIRVQLSAKDLLPQFVNLFFQTSSYWDTIRSGVSGSAQGGFNATKLGELVIPYPKSSKEQHSVVTKLDALSAETQRLESIYERKLAAFDALKKSLLHDAFTGAL